jgi:hypothetical protein
MWKSPTHEKTPQKIPNETNWIGSDESVDLSAVTSSLTKSGSEALARNRNRNKAVIGAGIGVDSSIGTRTEIKHVIGSGIRIEDWETRNDAGNEKVIVAGDQTRTGCRTETRNSTEIQGCTGNEIIIDDSTGIVTGNEARDETKYAVGIDSRTDKSTIIHFGNKTRNCNESVHRSKAKIQSRSRTGYELSTGNEIGIRNEARTGIKNRNSIKFGAGNSAKSRTEISALVNAGIQTRISPKDDAGGMRSDEEMSNENSPKLMIGDESFKFKRRSDKTGVNLIYLVFFKFSWSVCQ